MTDFVSPTERVNRYLKGRLTEGQTVTFEAELLDSPELQDELEVALALKRIAQLDPEPAAAQPRSAPVVLHPRASSVPPVFGWALAASLLIAAGSTTLLLLAEVENGALETQLAELGRPVATVLTVPVDIMRSVAPAAPDVRIRKPAGPALLVLDIELVAGLAQSESVRLRLLPESGQPLQDVVVAPSSDGRLQLALRSDRLPDGLLTLTLTDVAAPAVTDRRQIELLPAATSGQ